MSTAGVFFLVLYSLIGAMLDVYLGHLFQETHPIVVMTIMFSTTLLIFLAFQIKNFSGFILTFRKHQKTILYLNISSTISWIGFFFALKYIEPAISATLSLGLAPTITSLFWKRLRPEQPVTKKEMYASFGILFGCLFLAYASLSGKSALENVPVGETLLGVFFASFSALGVVGNAIFAKRLSDEKISAKRVLALRFYLLIFIGILLWPKTFVVSMPLYHFSISIILLAIISLVIPLFILQLGIERCEPITTNMILSSIPAFTYLLQFFDHRLTPSLYSLIGIALCVSFLLWGASARARRAFG